MRSVPYIWLTHALAVVEETRNAAVAGPKGIIRALTINSAFGFAFIIAIVSSVPDYMNSFFGPLALNASVDWSSGRRSLTHIAVQPGRPNHIRRV